LITNWLRPSNSSARVFLPSSVSKTYSFFDLDPGQGAPRGAQPVALAREFLFLGEQSRARGKPFVARNDRVVLHAVLLSFECWPEQRLAPAAAPIDRNVDINVDIN